MEHDERVAEAVRLHAEAQAEERQARESATVKRLRRDALLRAVRADDPKTWTQKALAARLGCSPELIALIERGPRRHPEQKGA